MLNYLLHLTILLSMGSLAAQSTATPNVLLVITDDQGYGDLGFHGNPLINTPVLDRLATESVRFSNFYVSPVCAPTRASLMTGRYSLRTGVRDTYNGGALMAGEEVTLAELLGQAGYRSGIFGKWHLGDNYPGRPSDQGFQESLVHLGGGMGQPGDFTTFFRGDSSYFDPVLWHNDLPTPYDGYCTDIFATAAADFIRRNADQPFFCYLAFNAPHTPLQLKESDYLPYADTEVAEFHRHNGGRDHPLNPGEVEAARRIYGMVSNIDENVGKLLRTLDSLGIADNTIVIFMSDNGPQQYRYNAGLRGLKGQVHEGGVRAPFFLRYPRRFSTDTTINSVAAHIDVLPTLAELCGFDPPRDRIIDGRSLVPTIEGGSPAWRDDRSLFLYWSRKYPVPYRNMTVIRGRDKLVGSADYTAELADLSRYDLDLDPGERINLVDTLTDYGQLLFDSLRQRYRELIDEPHLRGPVRIVIDTAREHPVYLNRNDAGGQRAIWTQEEAYGMWALDVATPGAYRVSCKFLQAVPPGGTLYLELGSRIFTTDNAETTDSLKVEGVTFERGPVELIPFYEVDGRRILPLWVRVE